MEYFEGDLSTVSATHAGFLDGCCSYGINAALLRCALSMPELGEHYRAPGVADLLAGEMIRRDRDFFARHERARSLRIVGLDASLPAIDYSMRSGLLDAGWMDDLERGELSPSLAKGS